MILVERMAANAAQASIVVFKKEDKESKELNKRLLDRREDFNAGKLEQDVSGLGMTPNAFTWSRLSYTVPIKGGQRQLLNDVWGYVKPGSLTALMGASGAGKTTLLDVLADRKTTGVISGEINMGGKPIDSSFQRGCGYAEQQVCLTSCHTDVILTDRMFTSGPLLSVKHSAFLPTFVNRNLSPSRKRMPTVKILSNCSSCRTSPTP